MLPTSAPHPAVPSGAADDLPLDPPCGAALAGARWSARVARTLQDADGLHGTLQGIVDLAAQATGVDLVVLVGLHPTQQIPEVLAATDYPVAERIIQAQRTAGSAPAWQAILDRTTVVVPELTADPRWRPFGHQVAETTSISSVAAFPLLIGQRALACLALYNKQPASLTPADRDLISVFIDHAAIAFEQATTQDLIIQLRTALDHARVIGAAVGIIMERRKIRQAAAFAVLRKASQDHNRKLYDIATQTTETGEVPVDTAAQNRPLRRGRRDSAGRSTKMASALGASMPTRNTASW